MKAIIIFLFSITLMSCTKNDVVVEYYRNSKSIERAKWKISRDAYFVREYFKSGNVSAEYYVYSGHKMGTFKLFFDKPNSLAAIGDFYNDSVSGIFYYFYNDGCVDSIDSAKSKYSIPKSSEK